MEFNYRFSNDLQHIFIHTDYYISSVMSDRVSLDKNNLYSKSLIIDISKPTVEIPIIARTYYEKVITEKLDVNNPKSFDKVILPLYSNESSQNRRTFDSIIHQIMTTSFDSRLIKIITNKGDIYYGGKGLILDKDYNPLLMCTMLSEWTTVTRDDEEHKVLKYIRPICRISPKVFLDSSKIIEKGIIKKVIPYYTNNNIMSNRINRFDFASTDVDIANEYCQVIIDKFDDFFITPVKPTPNKCNDEILNQCLVDNLDDVISALCP